MYGIVFQCALDTSYWTAFNQVVIWASILSFFGFTFIFYTDLIGYEYVGTARHIMSTAPFWFTMILTVIVLLVPVVVERFYYIDTRPTLADKVRLKQKITTSRSRSGDLILRRHSTMRRSTRSLRSGYAFAHTEGFGELITTGTNMRYINGQQKLTGGDPATGNRFNTSKVHAANNNTNASGGPKHSVIR